MYILFEKCEARSTLLHREQIKTIKTALKKKYSAILKHEKRAEKQDSYTCISRSKA